MPHQQSTGARRILSPDQLAKTYIAAVKENRRTGTALKTTPRGDVERVALLRRQAAALLRCLDLIPLFTPAVYHALSSTRRAELDTAFDAMFEDCRPDNQHQTDDAPAPGAA
jgi:hypothetical protein